MKALTAPQLDLAIHGDFASTKWECTREDCERHFLPRKNGLRILLFISAAYCCEIHFFFDVHDARGYNFGTISTSLSSGVIE